VDFTDNGYPDIHVANDFDHDVVYADRENGSFERIVPPNRTNRNGMASEVGDVTGGGLPDVFVTDIYYPEWLAENDAQPLKARGNYFIETREDGNSVLRSEQLWVRAGGWGWAAVLADLDSDGDEDLFHTAIALCFQGPRYRIMLSEERLEEFCGLPFYEYPSVWARPGGVVRARRRRRLRVRTTGRSRGDPAGLRPGRRPRPGGRDLRGLPAVREPDRRGDRQRGPDRGGGIERLAGRRLRGDRHRRRYARPAPVGPLADRLPLAGLPGRPRRNRRDHHGELRLVRPGATTATFDDVPVGQRLAVSPDGSRNRRPLSDGSEAGPDGRSFSRPARTGPGSTVDRRRHLSTYVSGKRGSPEPMPDPGPPNCC